MTDWMTHAAFQEHRGYDDERCGGMLQIVEQDGPVWVVECDGCDYEAGLPARDADPRTKARMRIDRAGFPAMFAGKPFEDTTANAAVKASIREWISSFAECPIPAPAIYGLNGRGKSHLLVATCEQLILRYGVRVWFRPAAALLDDLQDAFSDDREHRRVWERATTVDVLALDDLGAEQATDWRQERLARLVDERYQHERPIVLATNFPPASWEEVLGARTVSRLLGMTYRLELQGDDRRVVA